MKLPAPTASRQACGCTAGLSYDDAVEEALCFGWIDSLVRRLDEARLVRSFTPRMPLQPWTYP